MALALHNASPSVSTPGNSRRVRTSATQDNRTNGKLANRALTNEVSASSPYLRGDRAGGYYLGMHDKKGRLFRKWAERLRLPFTEDGGVRTYRKTHVDLAWNSRAHNLFGSIYAGK